MPNTISRHLIEYVKEVDYRCDTVIVGSGLSAMLTAYLLSLHDKKVILIQEDNISNDNHQEYLSLFAESSLSELIAIHGYETVQKLWYMSQNTLHSLEKMIKHENIDCDFERCSTFLFATTVEEQKTLVSEHQIAHELGIDIFYRPTTKPSQNIYGCLEITNQAKFDSQKLYKSLEAIILKNNVQIIKKALIDDITQISTYNTIVTTQYYSIRCENVVLHNIDGVNYNKGLQDHLQKTTYATVEFTIPKNTLTKDTIWDIISEEHFIKIDTRENHDYVIFGIKKVSNLNYLPENLFEELEINLKELIQNTPYEIKKTDFYITFEAQDQLPVLGNLPYNPGVLVNLGLNTHNNALFDIVAAQITSDTILQRPNIYANLFTPARYTNFVDKSIHFLTKALDKIKFLPQQHTQKSMAKLRYHINRAKLHAVKGRYRHHI